MTGISDLTSKLQYRARIDSVTKQAVSDFRTRGAVPMLIGLGERFGSNNRALISPLIGR